MIKSFVFLIAGTLSISAFAAEPNIDSALGETSSPAAQVTAPQAAQFSFAGHMTVKNDLPEPLQITIFEGDFVQAPHDEDTVSMAKALANQGLILESEIFYSVKEGKPSILVMMVKKGEKSSVLIMDLGQQSKNIYEVAERSEKRLVIGRVSYQSDLILEVK